jgi:hypothetical protein
MELVGKDQAAERLERTYAPDGPWEATDTRKWMRAGPGMVDLQVEEQERHW